MAVHLLCALQINSSINHWYDNNNNCRLGGSAAYNQVRTPRISNIIPQYESCNSIGPHLLEGGLLAQCSHCLQPRSLGGSNAALQLFLQLCNLFLSLLHAPVSSSKTVSTHLAHFVKQSLTMLLASVHCAPICIIWHVWRSRCRVLRTNSTQRLAPFSQYMKQSQYTRGQALGNGNGGGSSSLAQHRGGPVLKHPTPMPFIAALA